MERSNSKQSQGKLPKTKSHESNQSVSRFLNDKVEQKKQRPVISPQSSTE